MLNNNMLRNLHNSLNSMDRYQQQLASGKKISRASQDPVVAARSMFYRTSLTENEQFTRNAQEAHAWMELTDKALDEVGNIVQRISELLVYSGDGSLSPDDLKTMGMEVAELKKHMGDLANQSINGRYIFGGTETSVPPYDAGVGNFTNTNNQEIRLEISPNVYVTINANGQDIFNYPDNNTNIFKVLDQIIGELSAGRKANQFDATLKAQFDNLLEQRAALGARVNRIELILDRLSRQEVTVTDLLSKNEDADEAEVITKLKEQESVHRAALSAGARIIQPTLVDFLR
jgi:flagellar hook-associated protein 3 FlgL